MWSPQADVSDVYARSTAEALRGLALTPGELRALLIRPGRARWDGAASPATTPLHTTSTVQHNSPEGKDVFAALDDGGQYSGLGNGHCGAMILRMVAWAAAPPCTPLQCEQQDAMVQSIRVN